MVVEPPAKRAGAVSLANCVVYAIEVAYLNEVDASAPRIVSTTVPAGQRTDISDSFLPAGIEVEFALVLIPPIADGVRVRRKIEVAIDGDLYLAVRCIDEADPFTVAIALESYTNSSSAGLRTILTWPCSSSWRTFCTTRSWMSSTSDSRIGPRNSISSSM